MVEKAKTDRQLAWIYEGTKSLVNREDYLLGKRVDKNFELYSDTVIKEKEGGIEAIEKPQRCVAGASSSRISNLEVDIVRTEDPLVAIKMREERIWQEKMENPLVQLKMQKLMKKLAEKKEKKLMRKLKKIEKAKKRKHVDSCDDSVDRVERNGQRHSNDKTDDEKEAKISSRSLEPSKEKREKKHSQKDSHIPAHLRPKYSSSSESDGSEDESMGTSSKSRTEKYGLVKRGKHEVQKQAKVDNPYSTLPKKQIETYKKSERRQLTKDEIERKRREMLENANWRDEIRTRNIKKSALRDEEESQKDKGKAADFIRPMLNNAASTMTVEQQLKSHRRDLQRTCGFTEQNFVKR